MANGGLPSRPGKDPEFQNVVFQLTMAERLVAGGALIVVVVNLLIGDVILNDYNLGDVTWLLALAMLATIYFFYAGERRPWHDWYPWILEMGAWALGLIGAIDLVRSVFDSFASSGSTLFFQIAFFVAAASSGIGAFRLRTGD